jgi:hypothetical protein
MSSARHAQLPEDETPRLVDPKPPREVDELDELDDVEVPTRLLVLLLELLEPEEDLGDVKPVEIELVGRRVEELERQRLSFEDEPQFQVPQERRRRQGSCWAAAAGVAALGGSGAAC